MTVSARQRSGSSKRNSDQRRAENSKTRVANGFGRNHEETPHEEPTHRHTIEVLQMMQDRP